MDLSNKLRIPSEFPIGSTSTTKSYRLLTCQQTTYEKTAAVKIVDKCILFRILCLCSEYVEILPLPSQCLYLAFTFSPLQSAQFELKESPALIKISLKASKREGGLDEKFAKIKFQLLSSSFAALRQFSVYIHYKSTFGGLMSEMKFIFIKFPLPALCPEAQRKFEKVF